MHQTKVPVVSSHKIILSSQAHKSFNFELVSANLVSISKLKVTSERAIICYLTFYLD